MLDCHFLTSLTGRCLQTFWHSSSHVLGEALEQLYGVRLTIGPAVEEGFYYDCYYGSKTLSDTDKPDIEKKINEVNPHSSPRMISSTLDRLIFLASFIYVTCDKLPPASSQPGRASYG